MNKVILMGRLTRDAAITYAQSNSSQIARFTVAVDRRFKREGEAQAGADFISCVAFGKQAEFLERYGRKGTKFVVEGRIQTGSYNKDGKTVYTTDVVVESLEFAESKASAGAYVAPQNEGAKSAVPTQAMDNIMNKPEGIGDADDWFDSPEGSSDDGDWSVFG